MGIAPTENLQPISSINESQGSRLMKRLTYKRLSSLGVHGYAYETVRDFEKFTCQNSPEPNMRLDTNLAFFIN